MPENSESQPIPSRQLVIHVLLSLLVSVAVFAVLSYATLVPRLAHHEQRIRELEAVVEQMQEAAEEQAAAEAEAQAPAAQPAVAPSAPPAAAPAAAKK